jgi:hypothetical protein
MFQYFGRDHGLGPKPPPDMGKLLVQALQLCILGVGFLIYLDVQNNWVIWASVASCIAFGVVAGIVLDRFRSGKR